MTTQEIVSLRQKVQEYSGKDNETIKSAWRLLEEEGIHTTFEYFYRLILLLQPKLEQGMSREQRKVSRYVQEQLDKMRLETPAVEKLPNPLALALREAGVFSDELERELEEEERAEDEQDSCDLARFNLGVALFSRFKLEAPSSLMFWLLYSNHPETEINIYSYAKSIKNQYSHKQSYSDIKSINEITSFFNRCD